MLQLNVLFRFVCNYCPLPIPYCTEGDQGNGSAFQVDTCAQLILPDLEHDLDPDKQHSAT